MLQTVVSKRPIEDFVVAKSIQAKGGQIIKLLLTKESIINSNSFSSREGGK
jgi:hypothetical protein